MPYDYLKPILGDELHTQFCEKMNGATGITLANIADGSYIPKAKFDDANSKVKTLNGTVTELNQKLAAAQQQTGDSAALNAQITQLTADVATRDQQLASQMLQFQIKDALRGMNVRNTDVLMPLLKMDSISVKDGKLVGLQEQVDEIKKTDGYLFNQAPGARGGFAGGTDTGGTDFNGTVNAAIRSLSGRG